MGTTVSHHGGSVVLLLMLVICLEILSKAVQGPLKSNCISIAEDKDTSTVNLTCSDTGLTWFHVIQMEYLPISTDNCSPVKNDKNKIKSNSIHQSYALLCVGKQNKSMNRCLEQVSRYNEGEINGTQFVSVDYECVNESLNYNICEDVSLEMTGDVYLASPDMFYQPINNSLCRCRVEAAGLQLQALYIFLDDGNHLNMTCQNYSLKNLEYHRTIININGTTDTSKNTTYTLDMDFYDFNNSALVRNRVWLKISGTQNITVECNGGITSTSTAPITTPTSENTTTTTTKTSTQNGPSTEDATSRQTSPVNSSGSSTQGSAAVTSASSTSTLVSTTQNTTTQADTPTNTLTTERKAAPNSSDSTLESTVVTTTSVKGSSTHNVTSLVAASPSVADGSRDTVAYIIGGVAGGVAVLVCGVIIVVIICRWRRRHAKEDIHGLHAVSPETAETNSLEPSLTASSQKHFDPAYCEVDLDDGEPEQDHHSGVTKDCLQNGQSTFAIDKKATARTNGRSPQTDQTIPMTFQMKQKAKVDDNSAARDRPGQHETENKNFYFILEPEHEAAGDADSAGVSGSVTQASHAVAAEKMAEDFDDESYHYYSQIKDNEEAPPAECAIASKEASSSRREKKPFSIGDYEEVDLSDTKDEDDDDGEELIMMGNAAYVSADHDGNDAVVGGAAADDELVMLDNAAYVSAGPPNANHHESEDNDDSVELIMMDNVAYVSAGPPGSGDSKTDLNSTITAADASATRNDHHDDGGDTSANFDDDQAHKDQKDEKNGYEYYSTIKDPNSDSSEDELKMLDNFVYESYGSGGRHTSIV